jgi:hypothetical protein
MILSARRIDPRPMPKADGMRAMGLRYERKVVRALKAQGITHEHNPWISYEIKCDLSASTHTAVPDILIYQKSSFGNYFIIVAEVKLKYVPEALDKLQDLYCPIVNQVIGLRTVPLVIVKSLTLDTPEHRDSISEALKRPCPVYHWLGHSRIIL